jgi:hypothetical protein
MTFGWTPDNVVDARLAVLACTDGNLYTLDCIRTPAGIRFTVWHLQRKRIGYFKKVEVLTEGLTRPEIAAWLNAMQAAATDRRG